MHLIIIHLVWLCYRFLFIVPDHSTPMYSMSLSPHPGLGRTGSGPPYAGHPSSPQIPISPTTAIPTPSSAAYTFSLEGYMEPKLSSGTPRMSSRSQLPIGSPDEDSFPVFSPPPYPALQGSYTPRSSLVGQTNVLPHRSYVHRPSISVSSPAPSHHTCNVHIHICMSGTALTSLISFMLCIQ